MSASSQNPQEQAEAILAFADVLQNHTTQSHSSNQFSLPENILVMLDLYLNQLPILPGPIQLSTRRLLDLKGVELWNVTARLLSTAEKFGELEILSKVRTFAFALLESAASNRGSGNVRALGVSLKAARTCLENQHLELGLKILKIAAVRLDTLEKTGMDSESVATEYYLVRIHLSCLEGRPDIADHLFSKVPQVKFMDDEKNVMQTCYRVGRLALLNGEYHIAAKWLGRAMDSGDALCGQTDSALRDTRLCVLNAAVRANGHIGTADSEYQLLRVLGILKREYGSVFSALMLQLEILSGNDSLSCREYFEVLKTAVQAMDLNEQNLKMMIYYILKLRRWSLELAVEAFKELLLEQLAPSDNRAWIEQPFVTFIWMLTSSDLSAQDGFDIITETVKRLTELGQGPLSAEATHASLVLVCRNISTAVSNGSFSDTERWCCLVLEQPIFQHCSSANRAKLQRKLITSALESSNISFAGDVLSKVHEDCRSDPSTQYLIYKLALLNDDTQLGTQSLDELGRVKKSHLLSCAAEAQRLGKAQQAIIIFRRVITGLVEDDQRGIQAAVLFQSTICLLSKELEDSKSEKRRTGILGEICEVFEDALRQANKEPQSTNSVFCKMDFGWLFQSAYQLALGSFKSSPPGPIIRLLNISSEFANKYQNLALDQPELETQQQQQQQQHYFLCNFLKAIQLTSLARAQTNPTEKKTTYEALREAIQNIRSSIHLLEAANNQTKTQHQTILALDFEAATYLAHWASLSSIVEEAKEIVTPKLCAIFMNAVLSSDAPIWEVLRVVKLITCTYHKALPRKLPQYLHTLFQLALAQEQVQAQTQSSSKGGPGRGPDSSSSSSSTIAESVVDQVLYLAKKSKPQSQGQGDPYPDAELEWLATMAFNRAVDFYRDSADEECKRWAGKAIEVADLVSGEGGLGGLLRRNLGMLGL